VGHRINMDVYEDDNISFLDQDSNSGPCNALHFFLVNVYLRCVTEQGNEEVILNWVQILIQMSRDDSCFEGYNVAKKLL